MADEDPSKEELKPESPAEPPQPAPSPDDGAYELIDKPQVQPTKVGDESVLAGFDEDTDFDKDPALKAAAAKSPRMPTGPAIANPYSVEAGDDEEEPVSTDALIRPGLMPAQATAITGAVIMIVAAMLKWNNAGELGSGLPNAILTMYFCLLHAATGMVALVVMSLLLKRPVGSYTLGASRMFVVVSVFLALANVPLPFGMSFLLAAPGYLLALMVLCKVRPNVGIQIAGLHGAIAMAVQLGFFLQELGFPTKGGK